MTRVAALSDVQIDEPAVSARPDELPLAHQALEQITAGVRGRARTWTHLCYGEFGPVLDAIFRLPVDGLLLELSNSDLDLLEELRRLPKDKLLGAGVIDVHRRQVEDVADVRRRIGRLREVVPGDRLWINPDCGLKTRTEEEARAKLAAMMEAVRAT